MVEGGNRRRLATTMREIADRQTDAMREIADRQNAISRGRCTGPRHSSQESGLGCQIDRQIDRQTDRDKQSDRQTERQADRQSERQIFVMWQESRAAFRLA